MSSPDAIGVSGHVFIHNGDGPIMSINRDHVVIADCYFVKGPLPWRERLRTIRLVWRTLGKRASNG